MDDNFDFYYFVSHVACVMTFCTEIHDPYKMNPAEPLIEYQHEICVCNFKWNVSTNFFYCHKFDADIYDPIRMNWNNFGDPLIFSVAPLSCQMFNFYCFWLAVLNH